MGNLRRAMALAGVLACMVLSMGLGTELRYDNSGVGSAVSATYQSEYTAVAILSECHGDPNTHDRSYAEVDALPDANCAIWNVPRGVNAACVRFHIDNDGNTATVRAMTARSRYNPGDQRDHFTLGWQWAITGGAQADGEGADPNVFADTITATAYDLAGGTVATNDPNWIAEYEMDLRGVSHVAFYCADSDADLTVTVDVAVY